MSKILNNLNEKNIAPSSLKLYLSNLKRLNDGEDIKNFNFLKDVDTTLKKIDKYKDNTKRSYIISIVSLLKQEPKLKKLYDAYYKILIDYNDKLKNNTTKSEKQIENWITQDEVKKIYEEIKTKALTGMTTRKIKNYDDLLNYIVLSCYVLIPPRRNKDYQLMKITKKYDPEASKEYNYLDYINKKFYFNNYKTKTKYKTQEIDIPDDLYSVIQSYIKYHPLIKDIKKNDINFLVYEDGSSLSGINDITKILNKIFKKKIGSSLLRNIYLTSKYADENKEKKEDATAMGTSTNMIDNNYTKTN
jgi:hypothetical protein